MFSRIIKYILGFLILCSVQFVCNFFVNAMHFVLPAPILGIIVFALMLQFKIIKKEWVKDICNLLLSNMPLLFVPLFVGIMAYYGIIEKNLIPIIINVIVTTTVTLVVTALFVENVIKFVRLHKMRKSKND